MTSTAKRLGKRIIGYPEEIVPVVSSKDYVLQYTENPGKRVRMHFSNAESYSCICVQVVNYFVSLFPILGWITRYSEFHCPPFPPPRIGD